MKRLIIFLRRTRFLVLALLLALSIALNFATVAFSAFSTIVSGVFEAITGTTSVISELKHSAEVNRKRVEALDQELEAKTKQSSNLKKELAAKDQRVVALTDDLGRLKARNASLADDLDFRGKENAALSKTVSEKQSKIGSLTADLGKLEAQQVRLTTDLNLKGKEVAALSKSVSEKQSKIGSLTALLADPQIAYRSELHPLSEAVDDTVARISKRTVVGSGRNVSAVFAESIPMIGIGVAVAVTGYELKDGCDTLKDLHELEKGINPGSAFSEEAKVACGMEVPTKEEVWTMVKKSPGEAWEGVKAHVPELSVSEGWDWTKHTAWVGWYRINDGWDQTWKKMFGE